MEKALTGFIKHNIRFVKLEYNMDNMDLKRYTGKSFLSVHISDMHEIRMYSNTGYYIGKVFSFLNINLCFYSFIFYLFYSYIIA